jgi:uncharacterized protein (TIGR02099 family)
MPGFSLLKSARRALSPKLAGRGLKLFGVLLLAAYFLCAGGLLSVRYFVLPGVGQYREQIAAELGRSLGLKAEIAKLDADWDGLRPRLRIDGLVLREPSGAAALQLAHVDASVGWSSLLLGRLRLNRLVIDGPDLDIRRDADGRIFVAGLAVGRGTSGKSPLTDWVFDQHTIVVSNARVSWTDLQRGAPTLALDRVGFRLENRGDSHRFGLQATPPSAYASPLDVRGEFDGQPDTSPDSWHGALYGSLDYVDLSVWQRWIDYPIALSRGQGGLRIWLSRDRKGRTQAAADVALRDVGLRVKDDLPELVLPSLTGHLGFEQRGDRVVASAHDIALTTTEGVALAPTDFRFERITRTGKPPEGKFEASSLELAPLVALAVHLPLPENWHDSLQALQPRGRFERLKLDWTGEDGMPSAYTLDTRFTGLGFEAHGDVPGISGWAGEIAATERGGRFTLSVGSGGLSFPAVFDDPLVALTDGRFEGDWTRTPARNAAPVGGQRVDAGAPRVEVHLTSARFRNADAEGTAAGKYVWTGHGAGDIDLKAQLARADGARVWRYMPKTIDPHVREWLQQSIHTGKAEAAELHLRGPLDQFPYRHGGGEFRIGARVHGVRLAYTPGWPAIDGIDGTLLFERARMEIHADRGQVFGNTLHKVRATIEDLEHGDLVVEGEASGPTTDFLRFVNESPIVEAVGVMTRHAHAEGDGSLKLRLDIPLAHAESAKAAGEYAFEKNRLQLLPELPELTDSSGRLRFTESSLQIPEASGIFLGAPVKVTGNTKPDGTVEIQARGAFSAQKLAARFDQPLLAHLSGEANVAANVKIKQRDVALTLESDLAGISSSLPEPFNKSAATARPARVAWLWHGEAARLTENIRADVAGAGRTELEFETKADASKQEVRSFTRGVVALGTANATLPRDGMAFAADLPVLDVDAWERALSTGQAGQAPPLDSVDLKAGELAARGLRFSNLRVVAQRKDAAWDGKFTGPALAGDFTWDGTDAGSLRARLSRVALASMPEGHTTMTATEKVDESKRTPALDVSVASFAYAGRELGAVSLRGKPMGRDWKLDRFAIENDDGQLEAWGDYEANTAGGTTKLRFSVDAPDAGKMLARLGYPGTLRRGSAEASGILDWKGPPGRFAYASLNGLVKLDATKGQFSKINPGVGRLFGILSLQSLPRRLTLDFGDVFAEGFAFDTISGSIKISRGVMQTDDLTIVGPAAKVFMNGSADLAAETQSLNVKVQPTLSETVALGAAIGPAIGTLNPLIGVVAYFAQKAMRDPVEKFFTYEYVVSGSWSDPKVIRQPGVMGQIGHIEGEPPK